MNLKILSESNCEYGRMDLFRSCRLVNVTEESYEKTRLSSQFSSA